MTPDRSSRDDALLRTAYRQAAAQLDERPDPRVREAVLAAAAEATIATKPSPVNPFSARRWPLSMAAVLVVALMVGLVVDRAVDEGPDRIASVGPAVDHGAAAVGLRTEEASKIVPTAKVAIPDAAPPVATAAKHRAPETRSPATAQRAPAPPSEDRTPPSPTQEFSQPMQAKTVEPSPQPAAVAAAAPPAPESRAADSVAARGRIDAEANQLRRTAARAFAPAEPPAPEAWVARIVALRDAGNAEEADRELAALRRRYPDFAIPAAALGASGTR